MVEGNRIESGRAILVSILVAGLLLSGCRRAEPAPSPAPDMSETMAAPKPAKGYLPSVIRAEKYAKEDLALISVRHSVEAFQALHGRLPATLEELEKDGFALPELPAGKAYRYIPETGRVWTMDVPRTGGGGQVPEAPAAAH